MQAYILVRILLLLPRHQSIRFHKKAYYSGTVEQA